jgi:N-acetylglutamate synthase-like GNAT family acetyltransferase
MKARIRRATAADALAVASLIETLGYPAEPATVERTLARFADASMFPAVVAEQDGAVVGLLVVCCRPSLTLQGWIGTVSELVVAPAYRRSEIGEGLLHYAKGLAVERGLARLDCVVPGAHEPAGGRFVLERGFEEADVVAYRWTVLESKHPRLPAVRGPGRSVPA